MAGRILRGALLSAIAALGCFIPDVSKAQEVRVAPAMASTDWNGYAERMESLEYELGQLQARLGQYEASAGGGYDDYGCGCNPCYDYCFPVGVCYAGAELLWIKPHFEDESAFLLDRSTFDDVVSFDYDYDVSPRVWLGFINCCGFGGRARYWIYDNASSLNGVLAADAEAAAFSSGSVLTRILRGDAGDTFTVTHGLELQTLDAEATQLFGMGNTVLMGFAGVRYLRMEQDYQVLFASNPVQNLLHQHNFEGVGPTAGIEAWRPFGDRGFSLYGTGRGSVVFGETDQLIIEDTGANVFRESRTNVDDTISIGEVGLGLQWMTDLNYSSLLFVRSGWEGQYWNGGGTANSTSGNFALEGFSLALGIIR